MRHGLMPYRDLFSSQGPLHYPLLYVGDLLSGRPLNGPRVVPVLSGIVCSIAVWAMARRLGSVPRIRVRGRRDHRRHRFDALGDRTGIGRRTRRRAGDVRSAVRARAPRSPRVVATGVRRPVLRRGPRDELIVFPAGADHRMVVLAEPAALHRSRRGRTGHDCGVARSRGAVGARPRAGSVGRVSISTSTPTVPTASSSTRSSAGCSNATCCSSPSSSSGSSRPSSSGAGPRGRPAPT